MLVGVFMIFEVKTWWDWWNDAASNDDAFYDASALLKANGKANASLNELFSGEYDVKPFRPQEKLLLDVRSDEEHSQCHFLNEDHLYIPDDPHQRCLSVAHIPYSELKRRRFELPPRQKPFAILLSIDDECKSPIEPQQWIQDLLSGHGDSSLHSFHAINDGASCSTRRRLTQSWNVAALLNANDMELWRSAKQCGVSVVMARSERLNGCRDSDHVQIHPPLPRLWSPDPMLEDVLLPLLQQTMQSNPDIFVEIWDCGSGIGRDVCFLAEELLYWSRSRLSSSSTVDHDCRFRVVGWDQRYRDNHINDTVVFWKRRHVDAVASCQCVDFGRVSTVTELMDILPMSTSGEKWRSTVYCIYAVRYWNKPLFHSLVQAGRDGILPNGTIVAISQFGKSSVDATWDFPHPKEQHVLQRFELRDMFTNHGRPFSGLSWTILHDQVVRDSDHGRPIIQFVAKLV
jgi:hypothetical protein